MHGENLCAIHCLPCTQLFLYLALLEHFGRPGKYHWKMTNSFAGETVTIGFRYTSKLCARFEIEYVKYLLG